jgi:hypothetical protein
LLYEVENDTEGIGELEFFGKPRFELLYEVDNNTGGVATLASSR